jgi:hypothetical protein
MTNREIKDIIAQGNYLFLDDYRVPLDCANYMHRRGVDCRIYHEEWHIVRSYGQFINFIKENGLPSIISFGYDLADSAELRETLPIEDWFNLEEGREWNGLDCVIWLIQYCTSQQVKLPGWIVHSVNPDGIDRIEDLLKNS